MANRRIEKKRVVRREQRLGKAEGSSASLYTPRNCVVSVPCPSCGNTTLNRTYIPALGSMNGDVMCHGCGFKGPYLAALGTDMGQSDPLPVGFAPAIPPRSAAREPAVLLERDRLWPLMMSSVKAVARIGLRKLGYLILPPSRMGRRWEGSIVSDRSAA